MRVTFARPIHDPASTARMVAAVALGSAPERGSVVERFEAAFAARLHRRSAVATATGSAAITIALTAMANGAEDHGKIVVLPACAPLPLVNAVVHAGLDPAFIDIDWTLQMDAAKLARALEADEEKALILAIMPTHMLGHPAPITEILRVATEHGIPVIDDAAQALGAQTNHALISVYSFDYAALVSAGGGGMIVTDDPDALPALQALRASGRGSPDDRLTHYVGYSAAMTEWVAACLTVGMLNIEAETAARQKNAWALWRAMHDAGPNPALAARAAPHGYPLLYASRSDRSAAYRQLLDAGIEAEMLPACVPTRVPAYRYQESYYSDAGRGLSVAEHAGDCGLYLPCHSGMDADAINYVAGIVKKGPARIAWPERAA